MNIKTITTVDGVNVVDFGSAASRFYWIENLGSTTVYVSGNQNIVPDGDNVKVLSAGCGTMVENLGGKVYILGAGKFQITNQGDKFPPFRNAPVADGGVMASGNPVTLDGLQRGVPFSEMVVSGKNLIPFPYYDGNSKTHNGITFTVNSDGTVTANGTATDIAYFYIAMYAKIVKKGVRYAISGCPEGANADTYRIFINERKSDSTSNGIFIADFNDNKSFTVSDNCDSIHIAIQIRSGITVDNLVFRPQLELGDIATAYEPPITGRDLTVNVSGKNLLNVYIPTKREYVVNNTTFTINDDGSVSAISTETEKTATRLSLSMTCPPGDYMFSGSTNNGFTTYIYNSTKNTVTAWANPNPVPCHIDKENEYVLYFMVGANCKANGDICKPQLEIGSVATEYEPYNGADYTITPDSNPYVVPNDIRQQDGLNNISISEGELSVVGVRKNAAIKKIWDEIGDVNAVLETVTGGVT